MNETTNVSTAEAVQDILFGLEGVIIFTPDPSRGPAWQVPAESILGILDSIDPDRPLFFTPAAFKPGSVSPGGAGRTDRNVVSLSSLFFDFDERPFDPSVLREHGLPEPHYVFRRGSRAHVYYLIEPISIDNHNLADVNRILKTLAKALGADHAPAHVGTYLRMPGTAHVKNGVTSAGYELDPAFDGNMPRYHLRMFEDIAANIDARESKKNAKAETESPAADEIARALLRPRPVIGAGEGRSMALFHFGCRARDFGLTEERALELAEIFNAKYMAPPEPADIVAHQVSSAYRYAATPPGRYTAEKNWQKRLAEDEHLSTSLRGWVYVMGSESLRAVNSRRAYTTQTQINNAICYMTGIHKPISYLLQHRLVRVVDAVAFRPGTEERIIEEDGFTFLNTYQPVTPPAKSKNAKQSKKYVEAFKEHIRLLTNDEREYNHLMDYIAVALTRPGTKIKHSILLVSDKRGLGKSMLQVLFESVLGRYVVSASNNDIAKGNNGWMDSVLACFVHETGVTDRFNVLSHLKTWITEPHIPVSDKYIRSYTIDNYCNFFFFSNAVNALPLDAEERRFYTIVNRKNRREPEYYRDLYEAFTQGAGDIFHFLLSREVEMNPDAPAPDTEGKSEMTRLSRSELFLMLDSLYEAGELYEVMDKPGFSVRRLHELVSFSSFGQGSRSIISQKQLSIWLRELGFDYVRVCRSANGKRLYFRLYTKNRKELEKMTLEELKNA